jgi:hypothetical protein
LKSATGSEAAAPPEDPAIRFIRLELAPSRERWIATLGFSGLALIGVFATVTFRIPYPVLVFAGIPLLTVPPAHRPIRQAVETTRAAILGAGLAILLAITTYDQPWLYLPLQCAALVALLVLSRITDARASFILAALVLSFAEPAYLPDPDAAIGAALFNALGLAGTAWVVAAAQTPFAPEATRAGCAALALLMIAVGAPLMDDLGFFAVIAAGCYFAPGWVAHGGPRIAFACVPGAVAVTLILLPDVRFETDIVSSLLNVAGMLLGFFVTALIALLLAPVVERHTERQA